MLTVLHPWLTPRLLTASDWLVRQALSLQQYVDRWARLLDPGEDEKLTFPEPSTESHWCRRCQTHRTRSVDGLCPSCLDDDKKEGK